MSFSELKELGNTLMRASPPDYNGALKAYSQALTLCQDELAGCILTNRSLAHLKLGQNEGALDDANLAIAVDPLWAKGHWRKCAALMALRQYTAVLPVAQDGFKLLKSNTVCRDFVRVWLKACHFIFGDYEKIILLPTGTTILSEIYFDILIGSLHSRISTAKGMTEESMAGYLKRTADEFQRLMGAFGQPGSNSVLDWVEAVRAQLDPTISGVPVKLLETSLEKTREFCAYLSALDEAVADIVRPLVALAIIVILSRTYVLNCANICHHIIQYKLHLCLPIFDVSILNTPDYIGLHLGTAGGFLDSFVGRAKVREDAVLMEECCEKMEKLLLAYPTTAWEYTDIVDISTRIVGNVKNILEASQSGIFVSSRGLPDKSVKINAEFARRDADKHPEIVRQYIKDRLEEVKAKKGDDLFIRDAEDLLTLTDVCLRIHEKDMAKEAFELGERVMFTVFGLQMAHGVMGLDDAPAQLVTARQDVMMNALLLKDTDPRLFIDVAVRWKSLLSEFRASLIQYGLGRIYLDTYSNILSLQATGNLQQPYDPNIVNDTKKTHDDGEMQFLRQNAFQCFKAVVETPTAARIQAVLESDEIVLDFILMGENESFEVDAKAVLGMYLLVVGYNQEPSLYPLDSGKCASAVSKWREALNASVAKMGDSDSEATEEVLSSSINLTQTVLPNAVIRQLRGEQVKHVYIAPHFMLASLPLELLQDGSGEYVFGSCSVSYISASRELLREVVLHQLRPGWNVRSGKTNSTGGQEKRGKADEDINTDSVCDSDSATVDEVSNPRNAETVAVQNPAQDTKSPSCSDQQQNQQDRQTPQRKCPSTWSDNTDCFIIGDPNFDLKDSSDSSGSHGDLVQMLLDLWKPSSTGRKVNQLLHSKEEGDNVEGILAMLRPELHVRQITGDDATVSSILRLRSPFVVHISSHGFSEANMKVYRGNFWDDTKSAVVLAGYNTYASRRYHEIDLRAGSGMLSSLALSGLDFRGTRLVVLSMCLSGVGTATFQESVSSLADAARAAGAETVVATFWKVWDCDAAEFVKHFYNRLCRTGVRPSQAIKEAREEMREDPRFNHWYHWAAFACFGYDLPLFPEQNLDV